MKFSWVLIYVISHRFLATVSRCKRLRPCVFASRKQSVEIIQSFLAQRERKCFLSCTWKAKTRIPRNIRGLSFGTKEKSFRTPWKFRVDKPYRPKRNSNGTKRGQRSFGKTIPLVAHVSRRSSHIVNRCPRRVVQKYCTCSCLTHATWFGFHTGETHDTPWFNATSSSANYDSSTVAIDSDDVYGNSPSNCD